jgi:plasmid stabilization system protein ParE
LSYKIQITTTAKNDAREYAAFIRKIRHAPKAARKWLDGLFTEISELTEHPYRFEVIPEAEELGFAYRGFIYHSHRVIYAVHEQEHRVVVHRIWHGSKEFFTHKDLQ